MMAFFLHQIKLGALWNRVTYFYFQSIYCYRYFESMSDFFVMYFKVIQFSLTQFTCMVDLHTCIKVLIITDVCITTGFLFLYNK